MGKTDSQKFEFDIEFQWEILKYTLTDNNGYKLLSLYKHTYFDTIDQQIIARSIERHYSKNKRIPAVATLNEDLRKLFKNRDYAQSLLPKDRERIKRRVKKLYKTPAKDGETILENCKTFASYVEFKNQLERIDINNYNLYPQYSKGIQSAINIGMALDETPGSFLVSAHRMRIAQRQQEPEVFPAPFRQINSFTNGGGYPSGSILVYIDKAKGGKTVMLVQSAINAMMQKVSNARADMKTRRRVIYIDLENGLDPIQTRLDQCMIGKTKKEILSGAFDKELAKKYRDIARLGGEIYTIRLPSYTNTDGLQKVLDDLYSEYGIKFDVAVIDHMSLMGSNNKIEDETQRIGEAYLEVKNWALHNKLDIVITAHHVNRKAYERRSTKYRADDMAKAIDPSRTVDAIFGIQQNDQEVEDGVMRLEIIDQRDGQPRGTTWISFNIDHQRATEFSVEAAKVSNESFAKTQNKPPTRTRTGDD